MTQARAHGPAAPTTFGTVSDDGTVYLRLPDGSQRAVGQYAAGQPDEALAFYARRYTELVTEIDLAAKRLADDRSTPAQATATANRIRGALAEPAFVGDLALLVSRVGQLEVLVNVKKLALAEQRQQQRQDALAAREALATEAEGLAESDAWRATSDRFAAIIEEWKTLPQADRSNEQEIWKRLSAARTTFDKRRRAHYQELEAERDRSKAAKDKLIKEAEKLSTSRDWDATTRAYRGLVDKWKQAGRAGRSDDALWGKFKAAQDKFFAARKEVLSQRDDEEAAALAIKEKLADAAEKLLPVSNLGAAKRALREIQDKWEKAGKVPRADIRRIDGRLRAVEEAVRAAEQQKWKQANPELRGRASDTVSAFQAKIDKLERQLLKAQEAGDAAATTKARDAVDSAKLLLAAAEKGLARFS